MAGLIFLVVIAASAVWVYVDTSAHRVGNISEYEENFDKPALFWAIATLFLWPLALPYYLLRRRKLIEVAEKYPVQENLRWLKTCGVTLAAVGFVVTSVAFPGISQKDPIASCGSEKTQSDPSTRPSQKTSQPATADENESDWSKYLSFLELPDDTDSKAGADSMRCETLTTAP